MRAGREINLTAAVNKDTITRGLRYSIATGNWGMQGTAGIRAGVSQVLLAARSCATYLLVLFPYYPCCELTPDASLYAQAMQELCF